MALEDGLLLQEVEFPPTSLQAVCGDAEGSVEMDANLEHASDLSASLLPSVRKLRVMLPEESEMRRLVDLHGARHRSKEVSAGYLTTPSLLGDVGLDLFKRDVTEAVSPEDGSFLCAYPSFSVNEMLAVEELHEAYPAKVRTTLFGRMAGGLTWKSNSLCAAPRGDERRIGQVSVGILPKNILQEGRAHGGGLHSRV